ncbi:hypoxia-inducible factor 1-alpha-like isoform X2 [Saccostrea cucullata]|uniref:hypoxia-inducible factor 1-alpha-like isoform X2 n=1 Tax=Saccostrea cuccullata TaxID=36930 RepID=UPI002ED3F37B
MPYKNSEKRKEKSRDAARCRRGRETEIFSELADQIPQYSGGHSSLDKASIMRLAISYLKVSKIMETQRNNRHAPCEEFDSLYSKALDGFVAILSNEGDLVYISEGVSKYLGIQQVDLVGQSIYEFVHPCDHEDITDIFHNNGRDKKKSKDAHHTFFVRMKCTLTNKGKNVNLKSATYKVMKFSGKLIEDKVKNESGGEGNPPYLLVIGEPIPHPSNIEIPLDRMTFLSRHSMDMKFTYCDDRVKDLLGYNCSDLINKSLFDYHHAMDSELIDQAYKYLVAKGQVMTSQYRFLAKTGGHVWVITQGTVIYNSRTQKPQCVVCVHYVLSGIENPSLILSTSQQTYSQQLPMIPLEIKLSTEDVFKPRPENVKVDEFYFPPGSKMSSMKVDKNVDLTHLAPTSGDTCVPLIDESCVPFSSNLPLPVLKEEPDVFSKRVCSQQAYSPLSSPASVSPAPVSPMDYTNPLTPSVVDAMDKFFSAVDTYPRKDQAAADLDMDMRAPYIPMNKKEDFSLLPPTSDALFTINNDFNPGLFGRTESVFVPKDKLYQDPPKEARMSIRDMLVGSTAVASIEQPPDTFNLQMKRPLDMNSLEKGPPTKKRFIQEYQEPPKKHSVLMSLLVNGEDPPTGYSVVRKTPQQLPQTQPKAYFPALQLKGNNSGGKRMPLNPVLEEEVIETPDVLLQNPDLLAALELFLPNSELM